MDPAAQRREQLEVFLVIDQIFGVHDGTLLDDAIIGEGGLAKERTPDIFAVAFGGEDLVRSAEVQFGEDVAVGVVPGFARFAGFAKGEGTENGIAYFGNGDAGADFFDVSGTCRCPRYSSKVELLSSSIPMYLPSCPKIRG